MDDSMKIIKSLNIGQLFDKLVGAPFDANKVQPIVHENALKEIVELGCSDVQEQTAVEIWKNLSMMGEKSYAVRGVCNRLSLTKRILPVLASTDNDELSALLLKMFRCLVCYGMATEDMMCLLKLLQNEHGYWCRPIIQLLRTLREVSAFNLLSPSSFFVNDTQFTGIVIPPMKNFPGYGYSFVTWVRLEPSSDIDERGKVSPVLYSFHSAKGQGFSARFDAAFRLVVTTLGNKGRMDSETVTFKKNFPVFEWIMIGVVHTRGRFISKSTVSLYVDGCHIEKIPLKYPGVSDTLTDNIIGEGFQGQLGVSLLFNEPFGLVPIRAIYDNGPNRLDAYDDPDAVDMLLGTSEMKVLFDGTLKKALIFAYNAKACEKRLCLNIAVGVGVVNDWFVTVPHATLMNGTTPVAAASLDDCLRSVGGVQIFIPLFAQLDQPIRPKQDKSVQYHVDTNLSNEIFCLLSDMLVTSHMHQHQMVLAHGFVVIGYLLKQAFPLHLTEILMCHMLDLGRRLLRLYNTGCGEDSKRLAVAADVMPLSTNQWPGLPSEIVSAGLVLDLVKDYYWLVPPEKNKIQKQLIKHPVTGGIIGERPVAADVAVIRSYLLLIIRHTTTRSGSVIMEREDVRGMLSLLIVSHGIEGQVLDILQLLLIICTRATNADSIFSYFYNLNGLGVVLNVLAITDSETVKLYCIKVLGVYSIWVKKNRRNEYENMFYVLSVKLMCSVNTYIAIYEMMTNQISTQVLKDFSHWDGTQGILHHAPALETQFLLLKKFRDSLQEKRYKLLNELFLVNDEKEPSHWRQVLDADYLRIINRLELPVGEKTTTPIIRSLMASLEEESQVNIKVTIQLLNDVLNMVGNHRTNMVAFLNLAGWQNWILSILRWAVVECEASIDLSKHKHTNTLTSTFSHERTDVAAHSITDKDDIPVFVENDGGSVGTDITSSTCLGEREVPIKESFKDLKMHEFQQSRTSNRSMYTENAHTTPAQCNTEGSCEVVNSPQGSSDSNVSFDISNNSDPFSGSLYEDTGASTGDSKSKSMAACNSDNTKSENTRLSMQQSQRERSKHSDTYREYMHIVDLCFRLLNEIIWHSMKVDKEGCECWELILASLRTFSNKEFGWADGLDKAGGTNRKTNSNSNNLSHSNGGGSGEAEIRGTDMRKRVGRGERGHSKDGDVRECITNTAETEDLNMLKRLSQFSSSDCGLGECDGFRNENAGIESGIGDECVEDTLRGLYDVHCSRVWNERITHVEAILLCDLLLLYETEAAAWRQSTSLSEQVLKSSNQNLIHNLLAVIVTYSTEILPLNEDRDTIDLSKQSSRRHALQTPLHVKRSIHDNELADFAFGAGSDEQSDVNEFLYKKHDSDVEDFCGARRNEAFTRSETRCFGENIKKGDTNDSRLRWIITYHNLAMAHRFMDVIDVLVFGSALPMQPIERRFEWKTGAVLRLSVRLVCFTALHANDWGVGARVLGSSQLRALSRILLLAAPTANKHGISSAVRECDSVHSGCRAQEKSRMSRDELMRPLIAEKDKLRLRAVLYRDVDGYPTNAHRLLLIVLRFITRLVLGRYMQLLGVQGGTSLQRSNSTGVTSAQHHRSRPEVENKARPPMSKYFAVAFPRALDLFRESLLDFHSYLVKNLLTSTKKSVILSADSYLRTGGVGGNKKDIVSDSSTGSGLHSGDNANPSNNTALVMFMSSSDWLDAIRMQADPEWTSTTEEVAKTWERMSERLQSHVMSDRKRQSSQEDRRVHVNMSFEAFFVQSRNRLSRRKGCGQKERIEMAVALRLWLKLTDKLRYSLGSICNLSNQNKGYWKLDTHEDSLRRRMRLVPNHAGSSHRDAVLRKKGDKNSIPDTKGSMERSKRSDGILQNGPVLPKGIKVAREFKGVRWVNDRVEVSIEDIHEQRTSTEEFALDELYQVDNAPGLYLNEVWEGNTSSESLSDSKTFGSSLAYVDTNVRRAELSIAGFTMSSMMANKIPTMADIAAMARAGVVQATTKKISCDIVTPGLTASGTLKLAPNAFSFTVNMDELQKNDVVDGDSMYRAYIDSLGGTWSYSLVEAVYPRRHMLRTTAVEIFLTGNKPLMFVFTNSEDLAMVIRALPASWLGIGRKGFLGLRSDLRCPPEIFAMADITTRWQQRQMTNFEYLMRINTLAGRTYNDLNQYPVFPWVLSNYTTDTIDLNNPANYRDLSSPVGALEKSRLKSFVERYESWDDPETPAFHYGSHYSTGGYVLGWLLRIEPFTTLFLELQGGKFDHATRLFSSIQRAWHNCLNSTTDVKELIPELFYLPEMMINGNNYDLGVLDNGRPAADVELPPWANGDPYTFIRIHRAALESDYVSANLHHWIDLIFGYKQLGEEAVKAHNVFYPLTYEGAVDVTTILDPVERMSVEAQIVSFGQTPSQLLSNPHPPRNVGANYNSILDVVEGGGMHVSKSKLPKTVCDGSGGESGSESGVSCEDVSAHVLTCVDGNILEDEMKVQTGVPAPVDMEMVVQLGNSPILCISSTSNAMVPTTSSMGASVRSEQREPTTTDVIVSISNSMCYCVHTLVTTDDAMTVNSQTHLSTPTNNTYTKSGNSNSTNSSVSTPWNSPSIVKKEDNTISSSPKHIHTHSHTYARDNENSVWSTCTGVDTIVGSARNYKALFTSDQALVQADYAAIRRIGTNMLMRANQTLSRHHFAVIGDRRLINSRQTAAVVWTCGTWDGSFKSYLLNYVGGAKLLQRVRVHTDGVTCLALSENNELLLTGSKDTTVMVWKFLPDSYKIHRQPQAMIYEHDQSIRCLAVNKDHDVVASGSTKIFLHTCSGDLIRVLVHPICEEVMIIRLTSSDRVIAYYADHGGTLAVYTINGHLLKTTNVDEKLGDIVVSRESLYLVTGGSNGCVVVRLIDSLSIIHVYEAMVPPIHSLTLSSCERWIHAGADDGTLSLYKTAVSYWNSVALTRLD
eukprot:CFRG2008T1